MTGAARRIGWGVADQAVSSLTNFVALIVAAGAIGRASFGAFAVTLAAAAIAAGVVRAIAGEPLSVRYAASAAADRRQALGGALGAALLIGIVSATVVAIVGFAADGDVGRALLPLAVVLPGLALQDACRFALVADARPAAALASDLVWLFVQIIVLLALVPLGAGDVGTVVLVWGGAANVGLVVPIVFGRLRPQVHVAGRWLRDQRDLWPRFVGEILALSGAWQLALLGLGLVAGIGSVGAVRGAQVLLGPLNIAFLAVPLVMVPESSRWWRRGRGVPPRHAAWIGSVLASIAVVWGAVVLLLPRDVGRSLLGASWGSARPLVVPLTLVMAGVGLTLGALTGLRVLGAARQSLHARVVTASAVVVAVVVGGAVSGAVGASWGWAVAAAAGSWVWWRALARVWHQAPPRSTAELAVAP